MKAHYLKNHDNEDLCELKSTQHKKKVRKKDSTVIRNRMISNTRRTPRRQMSINLVSHSFTYY